MADKIRFKFEAKPVAKNISESKVLAMWLCSELNRGQISDSKFVVLDHNGVFTLKSFYSLALTERTYFDPLRLDHEMHECVAVPRYCLNQSLALADVATCQEAAA